jgi:hypothetical protein
MSTLTSVRRAGTALVASALAASLVAGASPAHAVSTSSPAGQGATWLAGQLNAKGLIRNGQFQFNDYGLTADTALALDAIGGHQKDVVRARNALASHVDDYTTFDDGTSVSISAGAAAKLLVLAQKTGGKQRDFGGVNLVSRLTQRVATTAPITGRIEDRADPADPDAGDFANTVGQVFAVRGLLKAQSPAGPAALAFLLEQQCSNGSFRLNFNDDKAAPSQGCVKGDAPDTDVTALAVIELAPVAKGHGELTAALRDATKWLKGHQKANGSFGGSGPTAAANANSTGLAGWALLTERACGAARHAAKWLSDRQLTDNFAGTPLVGQRGAIGYDDATLKAARKDGIVTETRDKWRRATSQAAPALLALSRCSS